MITNPHTGTRIDEIAERIYRINTPVAIPGAGQFSFKMTPACMHGSAWRGDGSALLHALAEAL